MPRNGLERRFRRFARTGDPAELAVVFDALAPRLLLLAGHLCGDRWSAEDLVQETFLAAMRDAPAYCADEPLLPWLSGILANRVRYHRRQVARSVDPERLPTRGSVTPLDEIESTESVAGLLRVVDTMPQAMREVLILHLQQGMSLREIAHTLGRPPETVRTQVRRGKELLRRKLPNALAVGVFGLEPERSLAVVRAAVLEVAESGVIAAGAAPIAGGILMASLMTKVAAIAVAVTLAVVFWPTDSGAEERPIDPTVTQAGPGEATVESSPPARAPVSPSMESAAELKDEYEFVARCVDGVTGAAIAGCRVQVADGDQHGGDPLFDLVSDAAGEVREKLTWPEGGLGVGVSAPGYVSLYKRFSSKVSGVQVFSLTLGCRVHGVARDTKGDPLPGIPLVIRTGRIRLGFAAFVETDASGKFVSQGAMRPGPLTVDSRSSDYQVTSVSMKRVPTDARDCDIVVVVAKEERGVTGVVVDRQGLPIAGAVILARSGGGSSKLVGDTLTSEDGTFVLRPRHPSTYTGPMRLRVREQGAMDWQQPDDLCQWGDKDLRLVVDRRYPIVLKIVASGTREPVTSVDIRYRLAGRRGHGNRSTGSVEGRYSLLLQDGATELIIEGMRPRGLGVRCLQLTIPQDTNREVEVVLPSTRAGRVRVLDAAGQPVAGSKVRVIEVWPGHELTIPAKVTEPRRSPTLPRSASDGLEWRKTPTGADGVAEIVVPVDTARIRLLVEGEHQPAIHSLASASLDEPVEITVTAGPVLRGRVTCEEALDRLGADAGLTFRPVGRRGPLRLARWSADGRFQIQNFVPGRYRVSVRRPNRLSYQSPNMPRIRTLHESLQIIDLDREWSFDLSGTAAGWVPSQLTARVFRDGQLLKSSMVGLEKRGDFNRWRNRGSFKTDETGTLRAEDLHPGEYRLRVGELRSDDSVRLVVGGHERRDFHLRQRTLHVSVLNADGKPLTGILIYARREGDPLQVRGRTDAKGLAALAGLSAGDWEIVMETVAYEMATRERRQDPRVRAEGSRVLGVVAVGAERESKKVFRLPAK